METRQRLLELWEKCPECKPELLRCNSLGFWFLNVTQIAESTAFDLACIAMVRWLVVRDRWIEINDNYVDKRWDVCVRQEDTAVFDNHAVGSGDTLTDALISAVEAVMEEK